MILSSGPSIFSSIKFAYLALLYPIFFRSGLTFFFYFFFFGGGGGGGGGGRRTEVKINTLFSKELFQMFVVYLWDAYVVCE